MNCSCLQLHTSISIIWMGITQNSITFYSSSSIKHRIRNSLNFTFRFPDPERTDTLKKRWSLLQAKSKFQPYWSASANSIRWQICVMGYVSMGSLRVHIPDLSKRFMWKKDIYDLFFYLLFNMSTSAIILKRKCLFYSLKENDLYIIRKDIWQLIHDIWRLRLGLWVDLSA